jgi:hypothetical protein
MLENAKEHAYKRLGGSLHQIGVPVFRSPGQRS